MDSNQTNYAQTGFDIVFPARGDLKKKKKYPKQEERHLFGACLIYLYSGAFSTKALLELGILVSIQTCLRGLSKLKCFEWIWVASPVT